MKNILIVEDEILISMLLSSQIEKYGYSLISLDSGEKALKYFEENNSIDLILMDIELGPGIDGAETARQIQKKHDIPVLFISNHSEKAAIDKIKSIINYGFVLKNSGEHVLMKAIELAFELYSLRIENEKKASDEYYFMKEQFQQAPFGILISSLSGNIHSANITAEKFTGYNRSELVHLNLNELCHQEKHPECLNIVDEIGSSNYSEFKIMIRRRDQSVGYFHICSVKIENSNILSFIQDVTAQQTAENELVEKNSLLDTILKSPSVCYIKCSMEEKILNCSRSFEEFTGFSEAELKQKFLSDLTHPNDLSGSNRAFNDLSRPDLLQLPAEKRFICKNGSIKWGEINLSVQTNQEGIPVYAVCILQDIDDKKTAEESLRRSEEQLRLFFEKESDYCYMINMDGNIMDINSSALNVLGYSKSELVGKQLITSVYSQDCQKQAYDLFRQWKKTGFLENRELTIISRSGERRTVLLNSNNVTDSRGEPVFSILIQRDITERKSNEEKISNLLGQQELIMREIHHRIKNDMNAIQSLLVLQYNSTRNKETKNALRDANSRISIMRNIYSRLYKHDDFKKISLRDLITELINDIQMGYETTTVIQHKVELSEIYIESKFAFRIGIIINELITNAYKHAFTGMQFGDINTKISRISDKAINIKVSNNGVALPEEILDKTRLGFGLNLVNTLSIQNSGSFSINNENGAVEFEIIFISD